MRNRFLFFLYLVSCACAMDRSENSQEEDLLSPEIKTYLMIKIKRHSSFWAELLKIEKVDEFSPRQCLMCKKMLSRARDVWPHIERVHLQKKNFFCRFCKSGFYDLYHCLRHEKSCSDR
ncbi:MAG: hypothetical protein US13_C0009G0036 [candidate division TM6 bacterium GW2011_GWE2_36_25]|nr:MAG: hypothetical protein US13_C0009G0036 [candidate division TM6 bacterium GW2011_GWE2_36_25]